MSLESTFPDSTYESRAPAGWTPNGWALCRWNASRPIGWGEMFGFAFVLTLVSLITLVFVVWFVESGAWSGSVGRLTALEMVAVAFGWGAFQATWDADVSAYQRKTPWALLVIAADSPSVFRMLFGRAFLCGVITHISIWPCLYLWASTCRVAWTTVLSTAAMGLLWFLVSVAVTILLSVEMLKGWSGKVRAILGLMLFGPVFLVTMFASLHAASGTPIWERDFGWSTLVTNVVAIIALGVILFALWTRLRHVGRHYLTVTDRFIARAIDDLGDTRLRQPVLVRSNGPATRPSRPLRSDNGIWEQVFYNGSGACETYAAWIWSVIVVFMLAVCTLLPDSSMSNRSAQTLAFFVAFLTATFQTCWPAAVISSRLQKEIEEQTLGTLLLSVPVRRWLWYVWKATAIRCFGGLLILCAGIVALAVLVPDRSRPVETMIWASVCIFVVAFYLSAVGTLVTLWESGLSESGRMLSVLSFLVTAPVIFWILPKLLSNAIDQFECDPGRFIDRREREIRRSSL